MSDAQYAEQLNLVKAARRHGLKWWGVAGGLFVLYLIIFGPSNVERAKEKEAAEIRDWEQEQRQKEQDQRARDAWRAFNR